MEQYVGKAISGGIAMGNIRVMQKTKTQIQKKKVQDIEIEIERYRQATKEAVRQLEQLAEKALLEMGEKSAEIFGSHQMLLNDEGYQRTICELLEEQHVNAEYAVAVATDEIAGRFEKLDDDYIKERANDIKDVSERLISILAENRGDDAVGFLSEEAETEEKPYILLAEELLPADIVQMNKGNLLAVVTKKGTAYSHVAILAKTLGIPALTQVEIEETFEGKMCIVDTINGILIIEPDDDTISQYEEKTTHWKQQKLMLQAMKGKRIVAKNGKELKLYANIGDLADLESVLENDAEGIGLVRSEFLFMGKSKAPTEEEQRTAYQQIAESMGNKPVIIRTLDLGGDKQVPYFAMSQKELSPFGCRGIRFSLQNKEILKTQLRAIFRAGVYGNISVMYPMVSTLDEVFQVKKVVEEIEAELTAEKLAYVRPKQGVMIETPAAALISDVLAKEVDFFSIGTNDLTQYTLALDRQYDYLPEGCRPCYEAVMSLIEKTVENAHTAGIQVGICGEMGADTEWTKRFMEMGIDYVSMVPENILPIRKHFITLKN